ncbi:MAG TPA: FHA domain-containing protein [Bryobacteraceae bacterium]|nr:FHA domain-containing protein [Bryobacteraceae bacterium]
MLVILEAVSGPVAGRRIEIRAGTILRIGRTAKSDYALGEDSYLSGQHFAIENDGSEPRVRDLGSSNGTFLNGEKVASEMVLRDGDSVSAGGSTFTVHIDLEAQPAAPEPSPRVPTQPTDSFPGTSKIRRQDLGLPSEKSEWPGFTRGQSVLLATLYRSAETVFAVLDPLRDARIPAFLDASGEQFASLDDGFRVAAYAVQLPPGARLLDVLVKDGWSRGWGFYCTSPGGLAEVCGHLKNFVTLYTPGGIPMTYRFWDPRVLRACAPALLPQEAVDFFGPLTRLIVEGEKPEMAVEYSLGPRGAKQQSIVLV